MDNIVDLPQRVKGLRPQEQALFQRLFHLSGTIGQLDPPETMHRWIEGHFGSVPAVLNQRIVKVTNLMTMEGALFNELRASRPMETREQADLRATITDNVGDPFCRPLQGTPADNFGRVKGARAITASNIAKYDGFHGLVIFDEHDPLAFTQEDVADYLDTAWAWFQKAHQEDERAVYPFLMWNCLWKSGASILHGHMQMTLSRDMHYARIEHLRRAALSYRQAHGANYFDDLYRLHATLGLTLEADGVRLMAYLTPIKEKELLLVADQLDEGLKRAIYWVLRLFIDRLGVTSFNLAFYLPPLARVEEDWSGFPLLARLVDRGDPNNRTADFGAMELYAASVIASDPFRVIEALREGFP